MASKQNNQALMLLRRLADLGSRLEHDKTAVPDWRRVRGLEDRIGAGFALENDIADAEALLMQYEQR